MTSSTSPKSSSISRDDDDGVILLVGRSSSGKSTLLRLIAGMEFPIAGCVSINGHEQHNKNAQAVGVMPGIPSWVKTGIPLPLNLSDEECYSVQPVILQGKPDFDDGLSVLERIAQVGLDTVYLCNKEWKCKEKLSSEKETANTLLQTLAEDFASLLTLSTEQCCLPPSELSPSGEYLFGIACACMISVAPSIAIQNINDDDCIVKKGIHYPILLFDELFDTEHPSTVELCSRGILDLISAGAVVMSATHRPGYFSDMATRTVTLSGGKVLIDKDIMLHQ